MPGYVMHLALAQRIIEKKNITDKKYINDFLIGSIIPDAVEKEDKVFSHFWGENELERLQRKPDLEKFMSRHGESLKEGFWLGYYCHLVLDYQFVNNYWKKHFSFFNDDMREEWRFEHVTKVLVKKTGELYERNRFFSSEYYYGDYSRMNPHIMKKYNISIPCIEEISLQDKNISPNAVSKLQEMVSFLHQQKEKTALETPIVFDLGDIVDLIEKNSEKLC